VLVAHTSNPSYSGGRDQEDHGSKLARANSSTRPYFEKNLHKKQLVDWLEVKALNSSPSTTKKRKEEAETEFPSHNLVFSLFTHFSFTTGESY
jgi:hypothetical protein